MIGHAEVQLIVLDDARSGNHEEGISRKTSCRASTCGVCSLRPLALVRTALTGAHRCSDEAGEERMRTRRTRAKLRMELAADEPRMVGISIISTSEPSGDSPLKRTPFRSKISRYAFENS